MRIVYVSYMHPAVASGGAQQVAFELFGARPTELLTQCGNSLKDRGSRA
jgi:hypothetical protein